MKTALIGILVILVLIGVVLYYAYRKKEKQAADELLAEDIENQEEIWSARIVRGDDTWEISVYPKDGVYEYSKIIETVELKVLDYVYGEKGAIVKKKFFRIGSDGESKKKCNLVLDGLEKRHISITFDQDLGMCYKDITKKDWTSIKNGMIVYAGNYAFVFTLVEEAYSGFIFENECEELTDTEPEKKDIELKELAKEGKKDLQKGIVRFVKALKKWFKKNF